MMSIHVSLDDVFCFGERVRTVFVCAGGCRKAAKGVCRTRLPGGCGPTHIHHPHRNGMEHRNTRKIASGGLSSLLEVNLFKIGCGNMPKHQAHVDRFRVCNLLLGHATLNNMFEEPQSAPSTGINPLI